MVGGHFLWLGGETEVHGYILGDKHYTQSSGGASRMTSPPLTLEIYTSIHEISPPGGDDRGGRMRGDDLLAS